MGARGSVMSYDRGEENRMSDHENKNGKRLVTLDFDHFIRILKGSKKC